MSAGHAVKIRCDRRPSNVQYCQVEIDGRPVHDLVAVSFTIDKRTRKPTLTLTLEPGSMEVDGTLYGNAASPSIIVKAADWTTGPSQR